MKKLWKKLKGSKRRISELALLGALLISDPLTKGILIGVGVLFGGVDALTKGVEIAKRRKS